MHSSSIGRSLVVLFVLGCSVRVDAATTGAMTTPRINHRAALMADGRVLITGGYNQSAFLSSAEIYDPQTGVFSGTGSMSVSRWQHTETTLPNGKLLVTGGQGGVRSAELYDPSTGVFTATGSMSVGRAFHSATLLQNGKVLIAGGFSGSVYLSSAELYDPATGVFTATGSMATARSSHSATLLSNGKVLIAGGTNSSATALSSAEIYDPATGIFTATGSLVTARNEHTATLLPNGQVLIVGGYVGGYLASAELYDTLSGVFAATGSMSVARYAPTATLLSGGKVLIAGGFSGSAILSSTESYDVATGKFSPAGCLVGPRYGPTGTLLMDGRVLLAGGVGTLPTGYLASAELFDPNCIPPNAVITAPSTICPNGAASASIPDAGPGATYSWSISGGSFDGAATGPVVNFHAGLSTGVTLNVTVTGANGCCASSTVTLPIPPVPITAPASMCPFSVATASVADAGNGATYAWSVTGGTIVGPSNGRVVLVRASGTALLQLNVGVTSASGCAGGTQTIAVKTVATPFITVHTPTPFCGGLAGTTLSVSAQTGVTYTWSIANGTITSGQGTNSISITGGATGSTWVQVVAMNSSGCSQVRSQTISTPATGVLSSSVFPPSGATGSLIFHTKCGWATSTSASWLKVTSATSGTGDATITFAVDPSNLTIARSASLYVDGQEFPVTQAGSGSARDGSLTVTTVAGQDTASGQRDGTGTNARFLLPMGIARDGSGNLYVAELRNADIRKIDPQGNVTTLAGVAGNPGHTDGTGSAARFTGPNGITMGPDGNLYVSDGKDLAPFASNTIRKVTSAGVVSTFTGVPGSPWGPAGLSVDGPAGTATFENPAGLTFDASGNLYVCDAWNGTIRKVGGDGAVTTLAGNPSVFRTVNGTGSAASFRQPEGIAFTGGNLYVADVSADAIRQVTLAGAATTYAGQADAFSTGRVDGTGTAATFGSGSLWSLTNDAGGNLYLGDGPLVRKIAPGAVVTTVAGTVNPPYAPADGAGTSAFFGNILGATSDANGNLAVVDGFGVRSVTSGGTVSTVAGFPPYATPPVIWSGGGATAILPVIFSIAVTPQSNIVVAAGSTIRQITPAGELSILAGRASTTGTTDGPAATALFSNVTAVATNSSGNIYILDNGTIRVLSNGNVSTIAGRSGVFAHIDGTGSDALFENPLSIAADEVGNVYVADSSTVRKVTASGVVTTFAGQSGLTGFADGPGGAALFNSAYRIASDGSGNVYVADTLSFPGGNSALRKITPTGNVTTIAGGPGRGNHVDGSPQDSSFVHPAAIAADPAGNVFVSDDYLGTIRKVTSGGSLTTVAGLPINIDRVDATGSAARLGAVHALAFDPTTGRLYVGDGNSLRSAVRNEASGDANGDGAVGIGDVFYTINHLFANGPATIAADVNGDGIVSAADIFYLINYLFAGGPAPK